MRTTALPRKCRGSLNIDVLLDNRVVFTDDLTPTRPFDGNERLRSRYRDHRGKFNWHLLGSGTHQVRAELSTDDTWPMRQNGTCNQQNVDDARILGRNAVRTSLRTTRRRFRVADDSNVVGTPETSVTVRPPTPGDPITSRRDQRVISYTREARPRPYPDPNGFLAARRIGADYITIAAGAEFPKVLSEVTVSVTSSEHPNGDRTDYLVLPVERGQRGRKRNLIKYTLNFPSVDDDEPHTIRVATYDYPGFDRSELDIKMIP